MPFENNCKIVPNRKLKFALHYPVCPDLCSSFMFRFFLGHEQHIQAASKFWIQSVGQDFEGVV